MVFVREKTDIERFNEKFVVRQDGCWEWIAAKSKSGYGNFSGPGRRGKTYRAHRWMWEFVFGEIPSGLQVDHLCNRRDCVNPHHMRVVSAAVNSHAEHSNAIAKLNSAKTHCPQGHEYTAENTYGPYPRSGRLCRTCVLARRKVVI